MAIYIPVFILTAFIGFSINAQYITLLLDVPGVDKIPVGHVQDFGALKIHKSYTIRAGVITTIKTVLPCTIAYNKAEQSQQPVMISVHVTAPGTYNIVRENNGQLILVKK